MSFVVDIYSYFLYFVLIFQMKRKGVILRSTLVAIKAQFVCVWHSNVHCIQYSNHLTKIGELKKM